jgi:hypothetical protein
MLANMRNWRERGREREGKRERDREYKGKGIKTERQTSL